MYDYLPCFCHFKGDRLPVETVSWEDAQQFCTALSKKLNRKVSCRWRATGSMPVGRVRPRHFTLARSSMAIWPTAMGTIPTVGWEKERTTRRRWTWVHIQRTRGACLTCTGMCGSGARTNTQTMGRVVSFAAARGARRSSTACGARGAGETSHEEIPSPPRVARPSTCVVFCYWAFDTPLLKIGTSCPIQKRQSPRGGLRARGLHCGPSGHRYITYERPVRPSWSYRLVSRPRPWKRAATITAPAIANPRACPAESLELHRDIGGARVNP